jgi:hypothetical protein
MNRLERLREAGVSIGQTDPSQRWTDAATALPQTARRHRRAAARGAIT